MRSVADGMMLIGKAAEWVYRFCFREAVLLHRFLFVKPRLGNKSDKPLTNLPISIIPSATFLIRSNTNICLNVDKMAFKTDISA